MEAALSNSDQNENSLTGLKKKFTLDEYLYELQNYKEVKAPSRTDPNDPGYNRKYAMSMPPLIAYRYRQPGTEKSNKSMENNTERAVFYCWNNLSDWEREQIESCKRQMAEGGTPVPEGFDEREVLKFCQANYFKWNEVIPKFSAHINWLNELPPKPTLSDRGLAMLQAGCMYIHGRDKYYRPIVIMDAAVMAKMIKDDKNAVTEELLVELWVFLYMYIREVMFLPGQADFWLNICHLGNLGMTAIPRKPIMAFATVCSNNHMFCLSKSFYLNTSWAQKTIFNGLSNFIAPETRAKICLTDKLIHQDLTDTVHPCQLERRFGGSMETPTNFWPPYVGPEFQPPNVAPVGHLMEDDEEYLQCIQQNPNLHWHPELMTSPACKNRDFIYQDKEVAAVTGEADSRNSVNQMGDEPYSSSQNNPNLLRVPGSRSPGGSGASVMSSVLSQRSRAESIYFDAYTGDDHVDQVVKFRNQIVSQATNVHEDGKGRRRTYENKNERTSAKSPQSKMGIQSKTQNESKEFSETFEDRETNETTQTQPSREQRDQAKREQQREANLASMADQESCCRCSIF